MIHPVSIIIILVKEILNELSHIYGIQFPVRQFDFTYTMETREFSIGSSLGIVDILLV